MNSSSHHHQSIATKAPFSFHCRICYERLNLTDRPPVVLPCGHTYICQLCSQRLTRCMECRVRLVPPKVPPQRLQNLHNAGRPHSASYRATRQRQQQQQHYPVPSSIDELHQVCKATAASGNDKSQVPNLPKNVVLMSLMEAAEQKQSRNSAMHRSNSEEDGYESGDDDEQVLEGLRTLSSSYGTYVVKAKEGLWVQESLANGSNGKIKRCLSGGNLLPLDHPQSLHDYEDIYGHEPQRHADPSLYTKSLSSVEPTRVRSNPNSRSNSNSRAMMRGGGDPPTMASATNGNMMTRPRSSSYTRSQRRNTGNTNLLQMPTPVLRREKLEYGQTVQIVQFTDGVARLARGKGFVPVENDDQLVKVGEPEDEACRIEGIIYSIIEEKRQYKRRIVDLNSLEKRMQLSLKQFLEREAEEKAEEVRRQREFEKAENSPAKGTKSVADALLEGESDSEDSPAPLTPPSSPPPPHLLEMSPSSMTSGPETPYPESRQAGRSSLLNTAVPPHLQPYALIHESESGNRRVPPPSGASQQAKTDGDTTHATGLTWDEHLSQSCDIFFCAAMPLCVGPQPTTAGNTSHANSAAAVHLSDASSIVSQGLSNLTGYPAAMDHDGDDDLASPIRSRSRASVHRRYTYQQQQPQVHHYTMASVPIQSMDGNESVHDGNSTISGNSVDFSTGLSGHAGLSRSKKQQRRPSSARKKDVRMMSQHDGIAHIRRAKNAMSSNSNKSVISLGEQSKASIATL